VTTALCIWTSRIVLSDDASWITQTTGISLQGAHCRPCPSSPLTHLLARRGVPAGGWARVRTSARWCRNWPRHPRRRVPRPDRRHTCSVFDSGQVCCGRPNGPRAAHWCGSARRTSGASSPSDVHRILGSVPRAVPKPQRPSRLLRMSTCSPPSLSPILTRSVKVGQNGGGTVTPLDGAAKKSRDLRFWTGWTIDTRSSGLRPAPSKGWSCDAGDRLYRQNTSMGDGR
jgi:hypothetical protein